MFTTCMIDLFPFTLFTHICVFLCKAIEQTVYSWAWQFGALWQPWPISLENVLKFLYDRIVDHNKAQSF